MHTVYCIPGLGLDHRIFEKLQLKNKQLRFLDWIPSKATESIQDYAKRMAAKITEEDFSLLGMSLGGIMCVEISRLKKARHLYLISTVKNAEELPSILRWMDRLPEKSKGTAKWAMEMSAALKPFYDHAGTEESEFYRNMIREADPDFIYWGIKEIAQWNFNESLCTPFTHVHGTEDLIFPIKNIDRAITVKGGSHFMIYSKAEEVSAILNEQAIL
jgi:pimeloyl-ACP methyl ester carboxylesterase